MRPPSEVARDVKEKDWWYMDAVPIIEADRREVWRAACLACAERIRLLANVATCVLPRADMPDAFAEELERLAESPALDP